MLCKIFMWKRSSAIVSSGFLVASNRTDFQGQENQACPGREVKKKARPRTPARPPAPPPNVTLFSLCLRYCLSYHCHQQDSYPPANIMKNFSANGTSSVCHSTKVLGVGVQVAKPRFPAHSLAARNFFKGNLSPTGEQHAQ